MAEFADILKGARLPETEVPLCLRGDLARRHETLERDLADADDGDDANSMAAGGRAVEIAEQIEALEAEMREHTHPFALKALPQRRFRDLVEQHPPRDGDREDTTWGVNTRTFPPVLIAACCVDPVMTAEQVEELCDVLTDAQLLELFGASVGLNRVRVDVPKSVAASVVLGRHARRSKPPEPGV